MKRRMKLLIASGLIALSLLAGANVAFKDPTGDDAALKAAPTLMKGQQIASNKLALPPLGI